MTLAECCSGGSCKVAAGGRNRAPDGSACCDLDDGVTPCGGNGCYHGGCKAHTCRLHPPPPTPPPSPPGPKPCSAGGKLCCRYNHSTFHSNIRPPGAPWGGPAPYRLDQHYSIDVADDEHYTISSPNGTFADAIIDVQPPADNCDRVNCSACAACGLPCGTNAADEACAKACPGACVERVWGQDFTATFSNDPSGRSNASKPFTLKGHVDDHDCEFITWIMPPDHPIPPTAGPYGGRLVWLAGGGEQGCCTPVTKDCPIRCPKCCDPEQDTCKKTWRCPAQ